MTENHWTRTQLIEKARAVGIHVAAYAPGDGQVRFRFFSEEADYFGGSNSIRLYTALGLAEARAWLAGYISGHNAK